jgi:two-component system phosphate regulon sensor histidine kinase PhoR
MGRSRFSLVYLLLMPAIAVAAGVLGYYSWQTATQYGRLGEETIAESTLLIVNEKVDQIEQQIIAADNAAFALIDLREPDKLKARWLAVAENLTPSIHAVLVLDDAGNVITYAHRGPEPGPREFLKTFIDRMVPDLELERQRIGRLKHLHQTYGDTTYLLSYKAMTHRGRRYYAVLYHDTAWITQEQFPTLFATEEGKRLYNVVDENNRRVYGENLANAGDYLVGRRFPTTLYNWRLQVAPKQAPLLESRGRSRRLNEVGLIATAFLVLLLGVLFLVYAADKERRLNALKAEFIANVSHELKTPLSVVRMFGEMLLTKRVRSPEKEQEYLAIICRESERLTGLIENVLDFAALERGKRKYAMADADLGQVVRRAIETFRYRIESQRTEVTLDVRGAVPRVSVDEQAILLAVINLLDNAVKHGGGSAVEVIIAVDDAAVSVRVRDHGPGIPREDLRRVFERFYRTQRQGQARGSGIGLSLVKHIAEAHGGRAWADNADGGGAIVGITLPLPKRSRRASQPGSESVRGAVAPAPPVE